MARAEEGIHQTTHTISVWFRSNTARLSARRDEAAAAVAGVPRDYQYLVTHSANTVVNELWSINVGQKR